NETRRSGLIHRLARSAPAAIGSHRRVPGQEQQVELGRRTVERPAHHAEDVGDDEAAAMHEVHDVVQLGTAFQAGDGTGLDDHGVHAVETAGHAFEHHQLSALDVDLAERRPLDVVDQPVEAPQGHAIVAQHLALGRVLEQGRGLDVRPDLDVDLAL